MTVTGNDPLIGKLVDSRYLVRERVARGGMATVYRATDKRLGRTVALKVMHSHLAEGTSGQNFVARFRREARAAARVTHPGLVAVYDQGVDGEISYLTLEFVEGSNLRQLLDLSGTLTLAEALAITEDILDALAAAHRNNLVHRDVKPENVLLSKENEVKLTDFGLARAVTEVTSTTTGTILGTVAYLAPELVTSGVGDTRTDIYAVGIMLYEMLVGSQPFVGDAPIHIAFQHINSELPDLTSKIPWIPQTVANLVKVFAAKEPSLRPANAAEALRHLKAAQAHIKPALMARRATPPVPLPDSIRSTTSADSDSLLTDLDTAAMPAVDDNTVTLSPERDDTSEPPVLLENASRGSNFQRVAQSPQLNAESREALDALVTATHKDTENADRDANLTVPLSMRTASATIALPLGAEAYANRSSDQNTESPTTAPSKSDQRNEKGPVSKRKRVLLLSLLTLLIAGAGYGGWYWWSEIGPGSFAIVPSRIEGVTEEAAAAQFSDSPLKTKFVERHDDLVPAGQVISAEPSSGERVKKDTLVTITVSLGIKEIEVPEKLTGKTNSKVIETLKKAGFSNIKEEAVFDTKVKNKVVMAVSVKEGATIPHNTEIVLTVSKGPEPITIPQVVAKPKDESLQILKDFELKVNASEQFSETVPKGHVISQQPSQGTQGFRGDSIAIVISKGPDLVTVPDVTGQAIDEAKKILQDLGLKVKENLFHDGFFGLVRFQDIKSGERVAKGSTISLTVF